MALLPLAPLLLAAAAFAQPAPHPAARAWRQAHERAILDEFLDLLRIPNVASDTANIRRNAAHIAALFERRGVKTRLLEAGGAPPVVYGVLPSPGAARTLIFYAHYDGQPIDRKDWATDPFQPVLRDGRIYARSASDDKAPIIAMLAALDALRAASIPPGSNLKFFFEGEEEAGSQHLEAMLEANRALLSADAWLVCDGPVHQNRQQQIVFGARGITGLELTVYGARRELHSGHYGNWSPNPAAMLARLLASMRDDDGRVLIEGFYDGIEPLGETERRALEQAPDFSAELQHELGLARSEGAGRRLDELINLPALNIRGLASANVGALARNVIPASATASIDIRLVKGIDHRDAIERLIRHVRKQGYFVTEAEPDEDMRRTHARIARIVRHGGYNAARTSMNLDISRRVIRAAEQARGPVIKLPLLGGSVPLYLFNDLLKTPSIVVPIVNHDNNQHSANENLRIQNLWDGIELMAALFAMR